MHKHRVGLPVLLLDTGEMGSINLQRPPQARMPRYRISVAGRPAIPSRAQGDPSVRDNVDESIVRLGMTAAKKAEADSGMLVSMRMMPVVERTALKDQYIVIRDDSGSTDHAVSEAIRYVDAITVVEGE